jgi:ACS family D-galactonate transporter-like MFS transporter
VIWYLLYRDPLEHPRVNDAELEYIEKGGGVLRRKLETDVKRSAWKREDWKQVFSNRTLWGIYIGQFCVMPPFGFSLPGSPPTWYNTAG